MSPFSITWFILSWQIGIAYGYSQCSPNMQEIFDYNVGDVHQTEYGASGMNYISQCISDIKIFTRYTILDKNVQKDTITYVVSGFKKTIEYPDILGPGCSGIATPPNIYSSTYTDSLVYIDSTGHYLNKCNDTISVSELPPSTYGYSMVLEDYRTVIQISEQNGIPLKTIGGRENIFNNDGVLIDDSVSETFEVHYGKNLGVMFLGEAGFENASNYELIGYVIDGDTTGTVLEDQDFVSVNRQANKNGIVLRSDKPGISFDILGRSLKFSKIKTIIVQIDRVKNIK